MNEQGTPAMPSDVVHAFVVVSRLDRLHDTSVQGHRRCELSGEIKTISTISSSEETLNRLPVPVQVPQTRVPGAIQTTLCSALTVL